MQKYQSFTMMLVACVGVVGFILLEPAPASATSSHAAQMHLSCSSTAKYDYSIDTFESAYLTLILGCGIPSGQTDTYVQYCGNQQYMAEGSISFNTQQPWSGGSIISESNFSGYIGYPNDCAFYLSTKEDVNFSGLTPPVWGCSDWYVWNQSNGNWNGDTYVCDYFPLNP